MVSGSDRLVVKNALNINTRNSRFLKKLQFEAESESVIVRNLTKGDTMTLNDGFEMPTNQLIEFDTDKVPDFGDNVEIIYRKLEPPNLHVGANAGQTIDLVFSDVGSSTLGISDSDISSQAGAERAITQQDDAIITLAKNRAVVGASMNRLYSALNFSRIAGEEMQSAESHIRDADMAAEIIEFTRSQVLSQAANAMLAQANLMPQNVLSLLG